MTVNDIRETLRPMIEQYEKNGRLDNNSEQKRLDKIAELKEQQKGIEAVVELFKPNEDDKKQLRTEWLAINNKIKELEQGRLF